MERLPSLFISHGAPTYALEAGAAGARLTALGRLLPTRLDPHAAYDFGRALAPLADEGVLIVGSGSLTHNLHEFRMPHTDAPAYVLEFAHWIRDAVLAGNHAQLREALSIAPHAARAHPTAEHYLPLLVGAGAAGKALPASVIEGGVRYGVLSMDSFVFGSNIGARAALHGSAAIRT